MNKILMAFLLMGCYHDFNRKKGGTRVAEEAYRFVQNRTCEYFPCHEGVTEETFNCLFCYCPLYALGRDCGGDFEVLPNGVKSCGRCIRPHAPGGYERVMERIDGLIRRVTEDIKENKGE